MCLNICGIQAQPFPRFKLFHTRKPLRNKGLNVVDRQTFSKDLVFGAVTSVEELAGTTPTSGRIAEIFCRIRIKRVHKALWLTAEKPFQWGTAFAQHGKQLI